MGLWSPMQAERLWSTFLAAANRVELLRHQQEEMGRRHLVLALQCSTAWYDQQVSSRNC